MSTVFHIASFYRFSAVPDPTRVLEDLARVCRLHHVKGTVLVAEEGINATISGDRIDVSAVVSHVRSIPDFSALEATWSDAEADPFPRLRVRHKREIVSLGVGHVDTAANTGTRIAPERWNAIVADPDIMLIDARNTYEVAIGTFQGAINPTTRSFTELPSFLSTDPRLRERTPIAMFCTGGIRCEKVTAYLAEHGFTELYQLDGGILSYLDRMEPPDSLWEGECYVFDRRVSVGHGLVPGTNEVCPNCNAVVIDIGRSDEGYVQGVTCSACHESITEDRRRRFAERQRQIDLARQRGMHHLGTPK